MRLKVYSLFKRTYVDILEPTDKDGKTINSEHIRMKGIPTPCIKYYAEQHAPSPPTKRMLFRVLGARSLKLSV